MNTLFIPRSLRLSALFALLLLSTAGCKKDEDSNPLLACRSKGGGGIGTPNARTVMFWINQDFGCGALNLVTIRNTETNTTTYDGPYNAYINKYFSTQPNCGTNGTISIRIAKGYEYEYTIACSSRQWKGKVTVDCSSDDCIPIQLQ
jgi:hypothetical protein